MVDSKKCELIHISHMPNIIAYLNRLWNSRVGPSGQITKLTTIKNAMNHLLSRIPEDGGSQEQQSTVVRMKLVETKIGALQKSLRKKSASIRMRKRDLFACDRGDRDVVLRFLNNKRLLELVQSYIAKDTLTEQEQVLSRRFIMCSVLYQNAQRQGPVCNLKKEELARAKKHTAAAGGDVYVYRVWEHKTNGQFGSAHLVVPTAIHDLVEEYAARHRPSPQPENEEYVFLTPGGRKVAHLSDDLRALSKDFPTELGVINVTATDMRKMTATGVAEESTDEATVRNVATHMSHSADTARRFYQHLQGEERSVTAYTTINGKRPAEELTQMVPTEELTQMVRPKKQRQTWLEAENDILLEHFQLSSTSQAPKGQDCGAFLMQRDGTDGLFAGRTKKEVQDKCRTIISQLKKIID